MRKGIKIKIISLFFILPTLFACVNCIQIPLAANIQNYINANQIPALSIHILMDNFTPPTEIARPNLQLQEDIRSWIQVQPLYFLDYDSWDNVNDQPTNIGHFINGRYYSGTETNDPPIKFFSSSPYMVDEKYEGQVQTDDGRTLFMKRITFRWQQMYVTMADRNTYILPPGQTGQEVYNPKSVMISNLDGWVTADGISVDQHYDSKYISLPNYDINETYYEQQAVKRLNGQPIIRLLVDTSPLYKYFKNLTVSAGEFAFTGQTYCYISDIAMKDIKMGSLHNESNVKINTLAGREGPNDGQLLPNDLFWQNQINQALSGRPQWLNRIYNPDNEISYKGFTAFGYYMGPPLDVSVQKGRQIAGMVVNSTPSTFLDKGHEKTNITIRGRLYDLNLLENYQSLDSVLFADEITMKPDFKLYKLQHKMWQADKQIAWGWFGWPPLVIPIAPSVFRDHSAEYNVVTTNGWEVNNVYLYEEFEFDLIIGAFYDWHPSESNTNGRLGYYKEELGDNIFNGVPSGTIAGGGTVDVGSFMSVIEQWGEKSNPFSLSNLLSYIPWIIIGVGVIIGIIIIVNIYRYTQSPEQQLKKERKEQMKYLKEEEQRRRLEDQRRRMEEEKRRKEEDRRHKEEEERKSAGKE